MSRAQNTVYKSNDLASLYHRITGKRNYAIDIDMIEYKYEENGKITPVAIIDFKWPGISLSDSYSSIGFQKDLAERLDIPFFFVLTYLGDQYDPKMYYVIPICEKSRKSFSYNNLKDGEWMTLKRYSKFLAWLRNQKWTGNEVIWKEAATAIGFKQIRLQDLPDVVAIYDLPKMEFSWRK